MKSFSAARGCFFFSFRSTTSAQLAAQLASAFFVGRRRRAFFSDLAVGRPTTDRIVFFSSLSRTVSPNLQWWVFLFSGNFLWRGGLPGSSFSTARITECNSADVLPAAQCSFSTPLTGSAYLLPATSDSAPGGPEGDRVDMSESSTCPRAFGLGLELSRRCCRSAVNLATEQHPRARARGRPPAELDG